MLPESDAVGYRSSTVVTLGHQVATQVESRPVPTHVVVSFTHVESTAAAALTSSVNAHKRSGIIIVIIFACRIAVDKAAQELREECAQFTFT